MSNVNLAFIMTLLAGLSTGIGSLIAFVSKRQDYRFLASMLGFSAGVMIYVSFAELVPQALEFVTDYSDENRAQWIVTGAFFLGVAVIALIDLLVPQDVNPHEIQSGEEPIPQLGKEKLLRTGIFTAVAITVHNFPEGLATFVTALQDPRMALPIAVAIALHNILEGIAVSAPVYYATGSKQKAFWLSFASGLAEPLGALIGYLLLAPFLTPTLLGASLAAVAGIMIYISFDELLPAARVYGEHHVVIASVVVGMLVMAASLLLLNYTF